MTGPAPVFSLAEAQSEGRASAALVGAATLRPEQAQRVFRAVLDALSRPGRLTRLPAGPLATVAAALLPVLALADLGTGVCVLDEDQRWTDVVAVATNAPGVPLERATLVTAVRTITPDDILRLCRGSSATPEDGALMCIAVSEVSGGPRKWRLSGPGVPGELVVAPIGLPDTFVAARAEAVSAFPAGVDLLLATPDGRVLGLPRSTTIVEEDD